jgi:hypothetical protein
MRAVNLIPPEQRRGAGGLAGRTGGAVYVIIGGLVALVACGLVYAFAVHSVAKRTTTLAEVTDQTNAVAAQAAALQPFVQFHATSQSNVESIASLAAQRFDWPRAMQQIALAMEPTVTIASLSAATNGTPAPGGVPGAAVAPAAVAPAVGTTGVTATPAATNPALPATFSLVGCATTQLAVANLLVRFRELTGVSDASVSTYTKPVGAGLKLSKAVAFQPCAKVTWNMTIDYSGGYGIPSPKFAPGIAAKVGH